MLDPLVYLYNDASELLRHRYALDVSETGLGKTFMALAAAAANNLDVVVTCPKAVKAGWRKAANHFGYSGRLFVENYEQFRLGKKMEIIWQTMAKYPARRRSIGGTPS